jgi:hypothetical protein
VLKYPIRNIVRNLSASGPASANGIVENLRAMRIIKRTVEQRSAAGPRRIPVTGGNIVSVIRIQPTGTVEIRVLAT